MERGRWARAGLIGCVAVVLAALALVAGSRSSLAQDACWEFFVPDPPVYSCVRLDVNKDHYLTMAGDVAKFTNRFGEYCGAPDPYEPAECGEGGGSCTLTEAQGVDFVNGMQTLVILAGIGIPCLVAVVMAVGLLFFRR